MQALLSSVQRILGTYGALSLIQQEEKESKQSEHHPQTQSSEWREGYWTGSAMISVYLLARPRIGTGLNE